MTSEIHKHPLFERQLELELEMSARGMALEQRRNAEAKAGHRESHTRRGSYLLKKAVIPVADAIKSFLDKASEGKAGRRHIAVKYLRQVDPEVAAFIALRSALDSISVETRLQRAAIRIGTLVETEARLVAFEKQDKDGYRRAAKLTEHSAHLDYKRKVFAYIANDCAIKFKPWPETDKLHLGQTLLGMIMEVTGYINIFEERTDANNTPYRVIGTDKCLDWLADREAHSDLFTPEYMPTIIPPKPWTSPYDGGYYTVCKPLKLVKTGRENYLEELSMRVDEMPVLYEAINAMQDTGYIINTHVLGVMQDLWDAGGDVAGIPKRDNYSVPRCPICGEELDNRKGKYIVSRDGAHACFTLEENAEAHKEWKRGAAAVYEKNIATMSRRFQLAKCLWMADKFKSETAIYFPMQLDFRGRCYAVPGYLNPQGSDFAKALLEFSEGKDLDSPEAVRWLAIHGANTFGKDKISLDERVQWVMDNEATILAVAEDPYSNRWWHDADKPWQFLAFCFEWECFKECEALGDIFVSHLPVAMDGTCNGLQIFSLMLRDPEGGRATNLLPFDRPQDIYAIVADKVTDKLTTYLETGQRVNRADGEFWYDEQEVAATLLKMGIDRKGTKRQVMVLPYGGTFNSCCDYTLEYLKGRVEDPNCPLRPDAVYSASRFLSALVWEAIGETVVAAREAMAFLQQVASLASGEGLPVNWTTPIGFIVAQAYIDMRERRVKTRLGDSVILLTIREEVEPIIKGTKKQALIKIDKRRQRNGISPNFVHSLDAAAMCLSISKALKRGVSSFMMIHDSYGTHASDAAALALSLREAFVSMFAGEDTDVLGSLLEEVIAMLPASKHHLAPPVPPKGTLDVSKVQDSLYFFA